MAWSAAEKLQQAVGMESDLRFVFNTAMGSAVSAPEMSVANYSKCFLHFCRNPFEMVVSGYMYHRANSESWLLRSFDNATSTLAETYPGGCQAGESFKCLALRGIDQVFHNSMSGSLSALLPNAKANDTFPTYLNYIDLDAGLIAEYIWASNFSLASMDFTSGFMMDTSCKLNVCFHDFYENCRATWEHIFQAWQLPVPEPHYSAALDEVTRSCPDVTLAAQLHSSRSMMKSKKILEEVPEHQMIARLRELDRRHLHGKLAAMETHLGCPVSRRYREPEPSVENQ